MEPWEKTYIVGGGSSVRGEATKLNIGEAHRILWSFKDLRGYDLAVKEEAGSLILYDSIVNVNVTRYTEEELKQEIQDWLDSAYEVL